MDNKNPSMKLIKIITSEVPTAFIMSILTTTGIIKKNFSGSSEPSNEPNKETLREELPIVRLRYLFRLFAVFIILYAAKTISSAKMTINRIFLVSRTFSNQCTKMDWENTKEFTREMLIARLTFFVLTIVPH
ncbi:MAG: hypothetical protein K0R59_1695 [Sphingobacterium sp.]|nr:hypothetical protein [Sphingobacterium sp.]